MLDIGKDNNSGTVTNPANPNGLAGGINQEWRKLEKTSQFVEQTEDIRNIMEAISSLISKTNRLDVPEVLDATVSTDIDVSIHAYFIQRLGLTTIKKRLCYKRYMESHEVPVKFYPPEYFNFVRHMRYRETQGAGFYALKHSKQTIMMFADAFGIVEQFKRYKLPKEPERPSNYDVPFPYIVAKYPTFQYYPNAKSYDNKLFQSMHFHHWMVGYRAPSEMAIMKTSNVAIDFEGNGTLSIVQPKRHGAIRKIVLSKSVLSSSVHKSFKNYIDNIRPKAESQYSKDFLYIQEDGKPFTIEHLGNKLSETGKMIYPSYHPYMPRHWCCIAKLIETKTETGHFDYFVVNGWMGHKGIQTTMDYVAPAGEYYRQYPHDWFGHALKSYDRIGKRDFPNTIRNKLLLGKVSPVKPDGLVEIRTQDLLRVKETS